MAKNFQFERKMHPDIQTIDIERHLMSLLSKASVGFQIFGTAGARQQGIDIVANDLHLGKRRRYGIIVKRELRAADVRNVASLAKEYRTPAGGKQLNEIWLVAGVMSPGVRRVGESIDPNLRIMTVDDFEKAIQPTPPPKPKNARARTRIGKAVLANEKELSVTIAAVIALIDEKLDSLRQDRSNSDEAKAKANASIDQYTKLREEVTQLAEAVRAFAKKKAPEKEVVEAAKTFGDGVQAWWSKSHESICSSTYSTALFTTAVSVCSLAGISMHGKTIAVVAGAIAGGKPLIDSLKGLGKSLFR